MPFAAIESVIAAIAAGRMVVLVDDEDRENEGDLVMAAEHATPQAIAFMATKGCGLICLSMEGRMLDRLGLPLMTRNNRSRLACAFAVSIDASEGISTGISAADRVCTIQVAISPEARPEAVVSPGHVFPIQAQEGGVLVRAGHSEASVDLARLAGCRPAGVICEIMKPDGTMARLPDLEIYCAEHGLLLASIADLIAYRQRMERLVEPTGEVSAEIAGRSCRVFAYRCSVGGQEHLALVFGERLGPGRVVDDAVTVRVQQEWVLGDVFNSGLLPGRLPVAAVLPQIAASEDAVLLYVRDATGARLSGQLAAAGGTSHLPVQARSLGMDSREYGTGAQILRHLGVRRMRLISGGDHHIAALRGHDLEIVERIPSSAVSPVEG